MRTGRSKVYFRSIAAAIAYGLPAVFSWHQWWYGGGFGARVLVEALSVLALPLAWLLQRLQRASIIGRSLLMLIILFRIRLDLHQQDRYAKGILHYDPMTREQYWEIFVKLEKRIA